MIFRRKKKDLDEAEAQAQDAYAANGETAPEAEAQVAAVRAEAPTPPPEPVAPEPPRDVAAPELAAGDPEREAELEAEREPEAEPAAVTTSATSGNGEEAPEYVDDRLPPKVWVESVLDNRPPPSREELDRQAAADFEAAIAPSTAKLREAVPEASSPDEARRILEEHQGEYVPDEEGQSLKGKDIFQTEASVHYRIQKHLERPKRRARFGEPWRPPADLARPVPTPSRRSLGPGG